MLKKLWNKRWMFRSILYSLYFNFHYLPIKQAIKLPIILYKPKLLKCKGKIQILGNVKTGMIQLGKYTVSLYPNSGIVFENHGGSIIFNGEMQHWKQFSNLNRRKRGINYRRFFFCNDIIKISSLPFH